MRFLCLFICCVAWATPEKNDKFSYHPLRKAIAFENQVYGIQDQQGRAMLRGSGDLSFDLGRFHDTFRLQLARSSTHLWIAYGPQVYGWDGQRLQPSLVTKLMGTKDAIEWLGFYNERAYFVKRTACGNFSLYEVDERGCAHFRKKRPMLGGRNQIHGYGHNIFQMGSREHSGHFVSLKGFQEKSVHLVHPSLEHPEGIFGVVEGDSWYGQLMTPKGRQLVCMNLLEKSAPLWAILLNKPLACAPVKHGDCIFFIMRESLADSFILSYLNVGNKTLAQVDYNCIPLSRDMSLDSVQPLNGPHRYAFILSHDYQGARSATLFGVDFDSKEELFYRALNHSTTRFVVENGHPYLTH